MIATLVADPDRGRHDAGAPNTRSFPPFRLRRPPTLEPPFDDERASRVDPSSAGLPNAGVSSAELPIDWGAAVARCASSVQSARAVHGIDHDRMPAVESSPAYAAARYVRLCLEVLNGFRPAKHLRVLTGPVEFADVVGQLSRRRNGHGHFRPGQGGVPDANSAQPSVTGRPARGTPSGLNAAPDRFAPPAAGHAIAGPTGRAVPSMQRLRTAPATQPFRLVRLRVSEPLAGIAEVVAVLSQAGSSLAMAIRLERRDSTWICTVVQVI